MDNRASRARIIITKIATNVCDSKKFSALISKNNISENLGGEICKISESFKRCYIPRKG